MLIYTSTKGITLMITTVTMMALMLISLLETAITMDSIIGSTTLGILHGTVRFTTVLTDGASAGVAFIQVITLHGILIMDGVAIMEVTMATTGLIIIKADQAIAINMEGHQQAAYTQVVVTLLIIVHPVLGQMPQTEIHHYAQKIEFRRHVVATLIQDEAHH